MEQLNHLIKYHKEILDSFVGNNIDIFRSISSKEDEIEGKGVTEKKKEKKTGLRDRLFKRHENR